MLSFMPSDSPVSLLVLLVTICLVCYKVYCAITAPARLPDDLPWIGRPRGLFSKTRARLWSLGDFRWQIYEVYEKVRMTLLLNIRERVRSIRSDLVRETRLELHCSVCSRPVDSHRAYLRTSLDHRPAEQCSQRTRKSENWPAKRLDYA